MYKNKRQVVFVGFSFEYKTRSRIAEKIASKPDVENCIRTLKNKFDSGEYIKQYSSNEKICIAIKDIKIYESEHKATILLVGGDKDIVDPAFWNSRNNTSRIASAQEDEMVSYSSHIVISLTQSNDGVYLGARENSFILSNSRVSNFLNYCFRKFCNKVYTPEDNGKKYNVYPQTDMKIVASKTIMEALDGKAVTGITLVKSAQESQMFDSVISYKKTESKLYLGVDFHQKIRNIIQSIKNLVVQNKREFNRMYINYSDTEKQNSYIDVDLSELNDFDTYIVDQKHFIDLNFEIGQCCSTIHQELESKMFSNLDTEMRLYELNIH